MQMKTGGRAAGKQQPVDIRLAAERLAGFPTALQQVEHPGGQAGLLPQLHHRFATVRGEFAGFKHHGIARQQRWHDMPVRQMAGKVIGAKDRQHAMRPVTQRRGAIGQIAVLFAGAGVVRLHRDRHLVDHRRHFPGRLPARLSGLGADNRRQLRLAGLQQRGKLFDEGLAVGKRQPRPGRERLAGSRHRLGDLPGVRRLSLPDNLQVNRILFAEARPIAGPPLAVNP